MDQALKIVNSALNSLRLWHLRSGGWFIDQDVHIAAKSLLKGDKVVIGARTHIDRNVTIEANTIVLGSDCYIARGVNIKAEQITLGRNCILFPDIEILTLNSFHLGDFGKISRGSTLRASNICIGAEFWMNKGAEIGGWGLEV